MTEQSGDFIRFSISEQRRPDNMLLVKGRLRDLQHAVETGHRFIGETEDRNGTGGQRVEIYFGLMQSQSFLKGDGCDVTYYTGNGKPRTGRAVRTDR